MQLFQRTALRTTVCFDQNGKKEDVLALFFLENGKSLGLGADLFKMVKIAVR